MVATTIIKRHQMAQLSSGSIGNPLLESGSIAIGALVRFEAWGELGLILRQIDSGSHIDSRFWVYRYVGKRQEMFGTYLDGLELIQFNTGSLVV
jgi:hypothetical protein